MAERTPSSIRQGSLGSLKLTVGTFAGFEQADYWESGITDIVAVIPVMTYIPTGQTQSGIGATFTASSGTIYATIDDPGGTAKLLVLSGFEI